MGLVWVTGISGAGKSTVRRRLVQLGHEAFDTDEDGFREWRRRDTGDVVPSPPGRLTRTFTDAHSFRLRRDKVAELHDRAVGRTIFLCGSVDNELEASDLFSHMICLVVDEPTLRHRLATRTGNTFGRAVHELESILEWHASNEADYRRFGASIIDATAPLDDVVAAVLAAVLGEENRETRG